MNVEENRLRTFANWPTNAAVGAERIAKAGFYYTGIGQEVQCFLCGTKITEWNYGDQAIARHRQAAPDCPFVINPSSTFTGNQQLLSTAVRSQDPQRQYKTMQQRLESFANWPISNVVSPERLAKAGFYYLQQADLVECAFCRGIILKWEPGDDPEREHRIHFPNCDFYMRQDNEDDTYEDIVELTNVKLMPGTTTDLKDLGIQTHTAPRRPKHATYEGRLRTFQDWPEELKQTPEMLATAGFFYVGTGDQVRCFHCDGGLRNWEATDDAWVEHAKWFPKCGFVNLVRGPEFIKECVDSRPPLDPAIAACVPEDETGEISETPPASLSTVSPPSQGITDAILEELLHTPPAMAALEIGLHVGGVKRALRKRMEETGKSYEDADQLIADVLRNQAMDDDAGENETEECESSTKRCEISDNEDKPVEKTNANSAVQSASLEEENRRLKEARLCKICMDREVAVVFLPCGHLATCEHCAPSLTYCSM
ncbi:hypothetical protein KPH14_002922, partial [Odynerus spinipes]